MAAVLQADLAGMPLGSSPRLLRISEAAAALSRCYGRGVLRRELAQDSWSFRWRHLAETFSGTQILCRVGGSVVPVGLDDPAVFGDGVAEALGFEVPLELRAACWSVLGANVWPEIERVLRRTLQVLEVQPVASKVLTADCLGFEIASELRGVRTRGFIGPVDADLQRVLWEASSREMPLPRGADLPIRWAAIIGSTTLVSGEVRTLQPHDVVVIDGARYAADGLDCRLGAGSARRECGRVALKLVRLHLSEFNSRGDFRMMSTEPGPSSSQEATFDEIPVSVRFELAQWQASLGEMAALAPWVVIELGQSIDQQSVSVWVEQRCIGKGQLVAIGERLVVRLLTVFA